MASAATPIKREILENLLVRGSAREMANSGNVERWLSIVGGGALVLFGLSRRSLTGLGLAALGGGLVFRAVGGSCPAANARRDERHNPAAAVGAGRGVKIDEAVTVDLPVEELYQRWRNFENLPRIMSHLVSVRCQGDRSHWAARGPAGLSAEWDAQIINEQPRRMIAWRSLEGSQIATAGSVHFNPRGDGRSTEVRVVLKYDTPAGKVGSWLASLFGTEPGQEIRADLRRFKEQMETGQLAGR